MCVCVLLVLLVFGFAHGIILYCTYVYARSYLYVTVHSHSAAM